MVAAAIYGDAMARVVASILILCALGGCAGGAIPPTYTQAELAERCWRTGGWWRPDTLMRGFCEYEAPGMP